jgi:hypothetical protein
MDCALDGASARAVPVTVNGLVSAITEPVSMIAKDFR